MFEAFAVQLEKSRGRYPVANLVHGYLHMRKNGPKPFRLGEWLASLELEVLEDVQTKLGAMLHADGPDHAGEDLVLAVDLLSQAEHGGELELTDNDIHLRLVCWFEAGSLEKLVRAGLARLSGEPSSVNPALRHTTNVGVTAEALARFGKD